MTSDDLPHQVRKFEFDLTMAEKVLHADFVLPAALRHVEAQGTAHGTAQGSAEDAASEHGHAACEDGHAACEEGHAAADASTADAVVGYGRERQMILIDSVQRSLLAPSLWASACTCSRWRPLPSPHRCSARSSRRASGHRGA